MRIPDTNGNGGQADPARLGRNEPAAAQASAAARTGPAGKPAGAAGPASESARVPDRLQLSNLASHLLAQDVDSAERTAFVDKLAADFAAGRYQPDADAISNRLIDEALGR